MQQEPDFLHNLNQEFRDGRRWLDRTIVLAYAAAAGLCVVAFTLMPSRRARGGSRAAGRRARRARASRR
jgi:hypothetical protein